MGTYFVTLACMVCKRLAAQPLPFAQWSLGQYGSIVNAVGLVYAVWSVFWSLWRPDRDVQAWNMNGTIALLGGVMVIAFVTYKFDGGQWYRERRTEVETRPADC